MKNTITAILAAALTFTLLTSCGSVDKTADVTVTTTESAWQPALITAASVTTAERQTSSTFTEKSTTTTKAVTTTKKTTTKKTTTSKATTTTKATTTAPITTTTAPRTTTTAAVTTTKRATTTTAKVTTTKKPATTTAAAAKLTQADIDRLVKEMQEYSNSKVKARVLAEIEEYKDVLPNGYDWEAYLQEIYASDLSNSSYGTPDTVRAQGYSYSEAYSKVKGHIDDFYGRVDDIHIVVYQRWCPNGDAINSDGEPAWEIYLLY